MADNKIQPRQNYLQAGILPDEAGEFYLLEALRLFRKKQGGRYLTS
jgi:hypothetical protein